MVDAVTVKVADLKEGTKFLDLFYSDNFFFTRSMGSSDNEAELAALKAANPGLNFNEHNPVAKVLNDPEATLVIPLRDEDGNRVFEEEDLVALFKPGTDSAKVVAAAEEVNTAQKRHDSALISNKVGQTSRDDLKNREERLDEAQKAFAQAQEAVLAAPVAVAESEPQRAPAAEAPAAEAPAAEAPAAEAPAAEAPAAEAPAAEGAPAADQPDHSDLITRLEALQEKFKNAPRGGEKYVGTGSQGITDGEDVATIQEALKILNPDADLGASGPNGNGVDGDFGSKTRAAIIAQQQKSGQTADGRAGENTIGGMIAELRAREQAAAVTSEQQTRVEGGDSPDGAQAQNTPVNPAMEAALVAASRV